MTPRQIEKAAAKIAQIKKTLAAEKRKYGAYDDSRGLRYLPTKYYIQLGNYKDGLKYLNWFAKNFPDDGGFPDFLFEWTIILFKSAKLKDATQKAFETFCANTYLFDSFYGRPIIPIDKWEGSNLSSPAFIGYFEYSSQQQELTDFSQWLHSLISSEEFSSRCDRYVEVYKKLKTEKDTETRGFLISQAELLTGNS